MIVSRHSCAAQAQVSSLRLRVKPGNFARAKPTSGLPSTSENFRTDRERFRFSPASKPSPAQRKGQGRAMSGKRRVYLLVCRRAASHSFLARLNQGGISEKEAFAFQVPASVRAPIAWKRSKSDFAPSLPSAAAQPVMTLMIR